MLFFSKTAKSGLGPVQERAVWALERGDGLQAGGMDSRSSVGPCAPENHHGGASLDPPEKKKTETRSTRERFRFSPWSPASIPRTISELRGKDSRDFPLFRCRKRRTAKHCRSFALRSAKTGIKSDGSNPTQERRESSLNTTTTLLYTHYNTTRCL